MSSYTKVIKVKKRIKLKSILQDLLSDMTDERIMISYDLNKLQLSKVYSRLYHLGLLSEEDLERRIDLRGAKDISHIPLAAFPITTDHYYCEMCGFVSRRHFTKCPDCQAINLRKITAEKGYGLVRSMSQFQRIVEAYASSGA